MSATGSQNTGVTIVYLSVCSGTDQSKHQSSPSLAFVRGIHRWPVVSPHKGPVTRKIFAFDDLIMVCGYPDNEECFARISYQGQGQVITSHSCTPHILCIHDYIIIQWSHNADQIRIWDTSTMSKTLTWFPRKSLDMINHPVIVVNNDLAITYVNKLITYVIIDIHDCPLYSISSSDNWWNENICHMKRGTLLMGQVVNFPGPYGKT